MADDTEEALGRVVAGIDGGELRPGQLDMARAVASAIERRRHLVVRAGTGTGKSLAYLVPAIASGRRVVVATATKALQDQLLAKDIPLVAAAAARPFAAAVLKGRSNYLCRQRVLEAEAARSQGELDVAPDGAPGRLGTEAAAVLAWAQRTPTGDRAELAVEPDARVWSAFSVTSEECPGAFRCPSGESCFAEAARRRAAEADVVVVNLHLLGADLASGGSVIPEHEVLVVDEAHSLEDVLSESLGTSISAGRLRAVAALGRAARPKDVALNRAADAVVEVGASLEAALGGRDGERLGSGISGPLAEIVELAAGRLERLEGELGRLAAGAGVEAPGSASATRALLAAGRLRADVAGLATLGTDDVAWIEGGRHPSLEIAPIDVAPMLAEAVFATRTVVLTSATVPPKLATRLGAEAAKVDELDVGSPFAYEQNALLYCAAHLPDRRDPRAADAIEDELVALVEAARGRTLALFTSRAAMSRAAEAVAARVGYPVLVQGSASKQALVERFSEQPEACLFATMGFWQGIDVPGSTCSLVVIDRIPFARPDEPLISARRERAGPGAFSTVDLPRAASMLAQGAGRLIRSSVDRGVVAVLDSRLATASYRWDLVRALPPMRRTKERAVAEAFLAELAGPVGAPAQ